MKKLVILLMITLSTTSCVTVQTHNPAKTIKEVESKTSIKQDQGLQFEELNGYFLKNSVKLPQEINFFSINSLKKLHNILGVSKTIQNTTSILDLNKDIVVVIATKPSHISNTIMVNKVYFVGSNIYIEYDIKEDISKKLGYFILNTKIFKIGKPKIVTNVYFVDDRKNITSIPFGNRCINSPESVMDMLKNYMGVYKGVLPTIGEEKIFTELKLNSDYTYTLKQKYLKLNNKVFESYGKWSYSRDLSSFILNNNKDLIFYFVDKNTIEKLDRNSQPINSKEYILKK